MQKDRLSILPRVAIMRAMKPGLPMKRVLNGIPKTHQKEMDMSARILGRRLSRPAAKVLARPRELFGESLPELLLVTAVVAAVISAVFTLNGAS
jgi:hypothetical protein